MKAAATGKYILLFSFLILVLITNAQYSLTGLNPALKKPGLNPALSACATDALLSELRKKPLFKIQEEGMNAKILSVAAGPGTDSYLLPVVFHIIHPDPTTISDAQVIAALNDLNDAFGKKGAYAASTGVDTRIQFCLAKKNPEGGNTSGITRTVSTFIGTNLNAFIEDEKLKDLNRWDPSQYINIWIITSTNFENIAQFKCGGWLRVGESAYATFPGTGPETDGIVLSGISPGPTLPHEMGHYLSLYHTFEGLNCSNNNCLVDGDRVCDTPPDASISNSPSCTSPENSCTSDTSSGHSNGFFPVDVPDMISNFMDYANEGCHNAFTEGQSERMRAAIATQRSGLLQTECDKPCADNSTAYFTRDKEKPLPGEIIQFTNGSAGTTQYQWFVNGVQVSVNTNYSTSFPVNGTDTVTLKAFNTNAACFASYTDFVQISCGVTASFYADKKTIASKIPLYPDSIVFTNNSSQANSYQWLLRFNNGTEQLVSSNANLTYTFPNPGNYTMRLIASAGSCSDTSLPYSISVADPTPDGIMYLNDVQCYQQTKIQVAVQFCNLGYATIPANMPVSFYDADPRTGNAHKIGNTFFFPDAVSGKCCSNNIPFIIDVDSRSLNQVWAVLNDNGTSIPVSLPGTSMQEVSYINNFSSYSDFQFHVTVFPANAVLEPGDSVLLGEHILPLNAVVSTYTWSTAQDLTCADCASPYFIAAKTVGTISKQLKVTSDYGCSDSSLVEIIVPPYNDYTITIDSMACAAKDSLVIGFTVCNSFKTGIVPKGLSVSFYEGDPALPEAHLLGPVFVTPADGLGSCSSYMFSVKGVQEGTTVFAVVNNRGNQLPPVFPEDTLFQEKEYTNNTSSFTYQAETVSLLPSDTTIFRKQSISVSVISTVFDPASTTWLAEDGYTLSCTQCASPLVTALDSTTVQMQTANRYGCLIKGKMKIHIFPSDMTLRLTGTDCFTNNTTRVTFTICMNNGYDSVFKNIPVSFYDGDPSAGKANLLEKTFYTGSDTRMSCDTFVHIIQTPLSGNLFAVVNDQGKKPNGIPDTIFDETDYTNNSGSIGVTPFVARIQPTDTTVFRNTPVQIMASVTGGELNFFAWEPADFISCTSCLTPVVTPPNSLQYAFIAQNAFGCIDTVYASIKTYAGGKVDIPNAFTPNGDGRNDVFYILGGRDIQSVKRFSVFNRLGQKMFGVENTASNDPRFGWDGRFNGKEAAPETYVYFVTIQFTNGTEQEFKGTVILIR